MAKVQRIELRGEKFCLVPEADYEALLRSAENAEDERLAAEALAHFNPKNSLPADQVKRMLKGESPVRVWREARGLSLHALAGKAGISAAYLSEIENGKKEPSLQVLRSIAAALALDAGDLV
jgi:DNA-binding XRE family transcriptional regulator